ncbi:MAG: hypothetical protein GTO24_09910 [candidate division Zixibacteria bacterium]|nr:hypothetical protein [candidate division Zixibacteria bacterium]
MVIKKALEGLEGVEKADISFKTKTGYVSFDPEKVSQAAVVDKVNQVGFKAEVVEEPM